MGCFLRAGHILLSSNYFKRHIFFLKVGPALLVLGKEAHENGLQYSLLQRLHFLYGKLGDPALKHRVHLKTNYRCHPDIMTIPNFLFYENEIIPRPLDAKTHSATPYPLLFICSSLKEEVDLSFEVKVLLQKMDELIVRSWPKQWGRRNLSDTCFITSSHPQVHYIYITPT